jgi:methylglyoxal/glyoxal reductase
MLNLSLTTAHTLNNGVRMPILGLGVYQMTNEQVAVAMQAAFMAGYRHIDTASFYNNEAAVGKAVRESGIPREEMFVTTKLWPTHYFFPEKACAKSLQKLGLEYVDLYLLHWPTPGKTRAWKGLETLYDQGFCKAIGVSNYSIEQLETLRKTARIIPAVNQVEFSPFLYRAELLAYCQAHGIQLEAYSPLTRGKKLNDATIDAIAKTYHKTPAQIMVRWSLQHGNVVIPKSSNPGRIQENANVFDFALAEDEMEKINGLHENFSALFRR